MKLHGYCMTCRRIKRVTVENKYWAPKALAVGTCDECQSKRDHPSSRKRNS